MYEDCPGFTTVFPLKLEAYRTDKWDGWTASRNGSGAVFVAASVPLPYSQLTPKVAEAGASSSTTWIWVVVVAVAAIVVIMIVMLMRRRGGHAMEE
jgi:low affinity Fe/Cu permease